jgi:dTDP-glucose pyrophosphorylase
VLDGWWTDAGTFESLFRASEMIRAKEHAAKEPVLVGAER